MFGTNPRFFIPGASLQYVRFQGEDEASDFDFEHRFEGDLTTQLGQMEEFIKANIVKVVLPELGSEYVSSYPLRAVKELLFNAVIHKDYQSNAPIKFYEFSDRIEISNAGGLYGKARPENFPNENDYRNIPITVFDSETQSQQSNNKLATDSDSLTVKNLSALETIRMLKQMKVNFFN